jgi:hypothetical protein
MVEIVYGTWKYGKLGKRAMTPWWKLWRYGTQRMRRNSAESLRVLEREARVGSPEAILRFGQAAFRSGEPASLAIAGELARKSYLYAEYGEAATGWPSWSRRSEVPASWRPTVSAPRETAWAAWHQIEELRLGRYPPEPPPSKPFGPSGPTLRNERRDVRRNSDERLRMLERRWRASPTDEHALSSYVNELERLGHHSEVEGVVREAETAKPPLPVVIRAWEDPAEQHRRLRQGEERRFWVRQYTSYRFDPDRAEEDLRGAGARIAPRSREFGELHLTPTTVFSGLAPGVAESELRSRGHQFAGIQVKTWGGDALPEDRRSPSLILLFPTEFCAPIDDCDSVMWEEKRGRWSLGGYECAHYGGIVSRTRSATRDEYEPAVEAYEAEHGRRLRVYTRSRYEFDRMRRESRR